MDLCPVDRVRPTHAHTKMIATGSIAVKMGRYVNVQANIILQYIKIQIETHCNLSSPNVCIRHTAQSIDRHTRQ